MTRHIIYGFSLLCAGAVSVASPAVAKQPAAAASVSAFGGIVEDERFGANDPALSGGLEGSLRIPVAGRLTAQADGLFARQQGETTGAAGLHVGMQVGERAFAGLYGSYATNSVSSFYPRLALPGGPGPQLAPTYLGDRINSWRLGAEAKIGSGRLSVQGLAGIEHVDNRLIDQPAIPQLIVFDPYGRDTGFFDMIDVRYQPSERVAISAGHRFIGGRNALAIGAEAGISPRISLFVDGRKGEGSYNAAWLGARFRFGGSGGEAAPLLTSRLRDEMFTARNTKSQDRIFIGLPGGCPFPVVYSAGPCLGPDLSGPPLSQ